MPDDPITTYFEAKEAVCQLFGYAEDWRVIPFDDRRGMYWMLTDGEGYDSKCVYSEEPLTEDSITDGKIYSGLIYTQRHLPKWVYRTENLVLVAVDTQIDGNKFLMIFEADKECTDDKLRQLYKECWGIF
jgi:hypothetical protein